MLALSIAGAHAAKQLAEVKGELEIRDVNFSYPQRPKVKVLRGFSLQAHAGQTVALVGASGNGKSTVVGLIERWYDVTSGQVRPCLSSQDPYSALEFELVCSIHISEA